MFTGIFLRLRKPTLDSIRKRKARYDDLCEVRYYHGGGMEGSRYVTKVYRNEDAKTIVSIEGSARHDILSKFMIYEVADDTIDKLNEFVKEYNMSIWDIFPESKFEVLDAPSTSLTLEFNIPGQKYGESVTISYDRDMPDEAYDVLNNFMKLISQSVSEGKLCDTYLYDFDDERKIYVGKDIENSDEDVEKIIHNDWENGDVRLYGGYDSVLIINYGDYENNEFRIKEIIHEPYRDHNASWYIVLENENDENKLIYLTMDDWRLFISDEKGNDLYLESK